jgi:enterochelin esterase-like enzyme
MRLLTCLLLSFLASLPHGPAHGRDADAAPATDHAAARMPAPERLRFSTPGLNPGTIRVDVHLPPGYEAGDGRYPVLYLNDGQDMDAVGLAPTLQALYAEGAIRPLIAVAIHMLPDRIGIYGLSDRAGAAPVVAETRYGPVGKHAHAYSEWMARTLVPAIDARYRTRVGADARAILGWSLGALNAFNLGWQYPELFGRVGAFSPSFWLSADRADVASVQRTRLAHTMVDGAPPRNGARYFFAVGTDEDGDGDDRDGDGIGDTLDDTRDLILGYADGPIRLKGLQQQGYSVNLDHAGRPGRADVALHVLDGGRHDQPSWACMLPVFLRWAYATHAPGIAATGTTVSWQDVPSLHVSARNVDIWLPPGYREHPGRRYPVLYMHDGQNLFDPALSYTGVDWGVDEAMTRLIADGRVREAIVVGVWNSPRRFNEYMPRAPVSTAALPSGVDGVAPLPADDISSDAYLRFIVEELKPAVDAEFRTMPGRDDTFVMGSSMGALISLYALARFPEVFGGAGAVSTHWPVGDGIVVDWLARHLPDPATHRLYFDHGTATIDAHYGPHQQRMDAILRANGYVAGRNWISRVFPGAEHNEAAWRARIGLPLEFLLAPTPAPAR